MKWPITEEQFDRWLFETQLRARIKRTASLTQEHQLYVDGGGNAFALAATDLGTPVECFLRTDQGNRVKVTLKANRTESYNARLRKELSASQEGVEVLAGMGAHGIDKAMTGGICPENIEFEMVVDGNDDVHAAILGHGPIETIAAKTMNNRFVFEDPDSNSLVFKKDAVASLLMSEGVAGS